MVRNIPSLACDVCTFFKFLFGQSQCRSDGSPPLRLLDSWVLSDCEIPKRPAGATTAGRGASRSPREGSVGLQNSLIYVDARSETPPRLSDRPQILQVVQSTAARGASQSLRPRASTFQAPWLAVARRMTPWRSWHTLQWDWTASPSAPISECHVRAVETRRSKG